MFEAFQSLSVLVLQDYDEQADVWSVGILMWQLLTGRFPFWDDIKSLSLQQVVNGTASRPICYPSRLIQYAYMQSLLHISVWLPRCFQHWMVFQFLSDSSAHSVALRHPSACVTVCSHQSSHNSDCRRSSQPHRRTL